MATKVVRTNLDGLSVGKAKAVLEERAARTRAEFYDSLRVAEWMLKNDDFLGEFEGSFDRAVEHLENKYFGIARQVMSLAQMLVLFRRFSEEQWAEYDYNMIVMDDLREEEDKKKSTDETGTRQPPKRYKELYEDAAKQLERVAVDIREDHREIDLLRTRLRDMEIERDSLLSKISTLEKECAFLRGRLDAAKEVRAA